MSRWKPIPDPEVGDKFGEWTVVGSAPNKVTPSISSRMVDCVCSCGIRREVNLANLRSGHSSRCILCARRASKGRKPSKVKHGLYQSGTYSSWSAMKDRCSRETHIAYHRYGGRGITVCEQWSAPDGFLFFLRDMGPRPTLKHSIERIDVDGNYEPSNCRWATILEQANNRSTNVSVCAMGSTKSYASWEAEFGVDRRTIRGRLSRGWDPDVAVSKPAKYLRRAIRRRQGPDK